MPKPDPYPITLNGARAGLLTAGAFTAGLLE